ncbi:hypothetical protein [Streptomyces sp. NPDC007264]|uniref:hypothetical protein n=1 Tax=Streptomyces sp. NPDC007264 TaxID=3364777 RepID=UPI0036DB91B0
MDWLLCQIRIHELTTLPERQGKGLDFTNGHFVQREGLSPVLGSSGDLRFRIGAPTNYPLP